MAESEQTASVQSLLSKGDGRLIRRGNVWTYPGAEMDTSGTNLRMPVEFVTNEKVEEALASGELVAVTRSIDNQVLSVQAKPEGDAVAVISTAQAGTAEAGTELPPNSRPSVDAGATPMTAEQAAEMVTRNMQPANAASAEGGQKPGSESERTAKSKEPAGDKDARRGR